MMISAGLPWTAHLQAMDRALAASDVRGAVRAWRQAQAEALGAAGWQGIVEVAGATLRIGAIPGFRKACEARARETYWIALVRARQQGSLNGVLRAAEAFGLLGDRAMVEECVRVAERLAAQTSDGRTAERVSALAAELGERLLVTRAAAPTRPS